MAGYDGGVRRGLRVKLMSVSNGVVKINCSRTRKAIKKDERL